MTRVCYITGMLPSSGRNGTEIATENTFEALKLEGHQVELVGMLRAGEKPRDESAIVLDEITIEAAEADTLTRIKWLITSAIKNEPVSVSKFRTSALKGAARAISGAEVVLIDKPQLFAIFSDLIREVPVSVLWHAIEWKTYSHVVQSSRGLRKLVYQREADLALNMERKVAQAATHIFALSEQDEADLRELGFSGPVDILPLVTSLCPRSETSTNEQIAERETGRKKVGLLGNWLWSANHDGMQWFIREVVPLLESDIDVEVGGAGSNMYDFGSPNVRGVGRVESAEDFLGGKDVVVIPLISGTGISMKVVEASSFGWPTVTTPKGVRGLEHDLPTNVFVGIDGSDFATKINMACKLPAMGMKARNDGADWHTRRISSFRQVLTRGLSAAARSALDR